MFKKVFFSILIFLALFTVTFAIIAYGRGYRFNLGQKSITTTGILSTVSFPDGASIYLDGKLVSATNASLNLTPAWYQIKIIKDGYQSWEKRINIKGEVVSKVDAFLIPINPSLRALTVSGILSPTLSPTGSKTAYIIPQEDSTSSAILKPKTGVWMIDLRSGPLGGKSEPKAIYLTRNQFDWNNAKLTWSPDEKQLLLSFQNKEDKKETVSNNYLLSTDGENTILTDVTSKLSDIQTSWKEMKDQKDDENLSTLPPVLSNFLKSNTTRIKFSPDENRIFFQATASATLSAVITPPLIGTNPTEEVRKIEKGNYYIYDLKEDKNYFFGDSKLVTDPTSVIWYSDSKHIIMIDKESIYIIDYDGANKRPIYSGPFLSNLVYSWTTGGKIIILTNLHNPQSLPNLYEIDLR
jgi:dipeptidyl aminopeptidase/acylaminoacyl peptidase